MEQQRPTILVVEDDDVIRGLFQRHLEEAGYGVQEARDGLEAIQLVRQNRYALVITDNQMPRLTGLELLAILQKLDDPTPVLLVSNYLDEDMNKQALLYGAAVTVPKPTGRAQLLRIIKQVCSAPQYGIA
jgi:two-component system response regulator HydG